MFEEIPETPYGMNKRIRFIYGEIEKRIRNSKDRREIKVLDIGCGTGKFITIPLGSLGVTILGIDTHLPSIEYARKRNPFENIQFECMPVEELAGQQFDFIICSEVLEHLNEPMDMVKLIKKMLKMDGICIITIPNRYNPREIEERVYRALCNKGINFLTQFLRSRNDTLNTESWHVQFFSYKDFRDLLEKCELSIIECENRSSFVGFFSNRILSSSKVLTKWSVRIANRLPHSLTSGWMFVIGHNKEETGSW